MVKSFDCSNCGGFHSRPINRNYKGPKVDMETDSMDRNSQILHELKNVSSRMSKTEDKVQEINEKRSPARSTATASSKSRDDDLDDGLVLPSMASLQLSNRIQSEVDARIKELQQISDKGKCKSQRGGSETVFVKHEVS